MAPTTTTVAPDGTARQDTADVVDLRGEAERLVKSTERVRYLGEVFTPSGTVRAMLDLLPDEMWEPHPSPTFLEPACGDGNFLVEILNRKLDRLTALWRRGELPAGDDNHALHFHGLEALASIYAMDISADNIIGGTPGHEVGAQQRLRSTFVAWFANTLGAKPANRTLIVRSANWILDHNLQVANMLETNADGTASGRDSIPLVEYTWHPTTKTVELATTTLGAVMEAADQASPGALSLFGPPEPEVVWAGPAVRLCEAPIATPSNRVQHARNGKSGR